ncbi:MAG: dihydrodipicolinate synthase family protein [Deltaproteobacteria bacterium]|nr:dihydrodipicolinate synthase family protein [Deltaproteobacteria bacterium]
MPVPPKGLIVDLVTPLHPDLSLDEAGLGRLVDRVISQADAILGGSPDVGEALDLPLAVRRRLLTALVSSVAGRVPLFLGITGHSEQETRDLAAAVYEDCRRLHPGTPVFLADLPLWYHSNRGLPQFCRRLLTESPLPLILLNLPRSISRRAPAFKHRNIRTHVFKKLMAIPEVAGLVHQGEMRRFLNYHYAAGRRTGFAFYEADEENFLSRPGAWGVLSPGAQLFPAFWRLVTRVCLHPEEVAKDPELRLEAWNLGQRLQRLTRIYRSFPAPLLKAALAAQGILDRATIAPGTPAPPPDKRLELLALLESLNH